MLKSDDAYVYFINELKTFMLSHKDIVTNTLSNIFSMRIIGNKTHGDLAEVGISEFINQFLSEKFTSKHVGKDLFRNKSHEEDILVTCKGGIYNGKEIPISLKAYGDGPLQLSTDKDSNLYSLLSSKGDDIDNKNEIMEIISSPEFHTLSSINIFPLIYDEKNQRCNIMIFDLNKAFLSTERILYIGKDKYYDNISKRVSDGNGRKHPIYMFLDKNGKYICEVRYGGAAANALQRGFWTHTVNAVQYFTSLTDGWIKYEINNDLVELMGLVLNATKNKHREINRLLSENIDEIKGHVCL